MKKLRDVIKEKMKNIHIMKNEIINVEIKDTNGVDNDELENSIL